jgi:carotenoid cleavage dioxygenase-like enzyme
LITYVHGERCGTTSLDIYDARSMAAQPLASVALPQRVPYGFHGLFVPEARLQQQWQG